MSIKKQSIKSLADGISKFENSKNIAKNSDLSDFKQFLRNYLNAPESIQRRKLAEEFKKRHLELYSFLKDNQELISAETEITRIINEIFLDSKKSSEEIKTSGKLADIFAQIGGESIEHKE
ncbi:MAG TPA: hypothetical protein DCQ78_02805 [Ruminococcus sp.]|nr:hypothetical protein [Ruminococcus sp.]